ncbi:MAG: hypothetical protein V3T70_01410, partial [Phycisphaerae bacterium]
PERVLRSVAALAGGASKMLTDTLLPKPLRESRTYEALVGSAQRILIEKVAEAEGVYEAQQEELPADYVPRKVAGGVIEAAGTFSMHLSPLWVFAIASDVAGGSRQYLNRLTEQLRHEGVIEADASVERVDDLLSAMCKASEASAQLFDAPPLSADDIGRFRDELLGRYADVFRNTGELMPRIDELWSRMTSLADGDAAMAKVAGLMSMDLGRAGGRALDGVFTVGRTTVEFLAESILDSYADSLAEVERRGIVACMEEASRPYVAAFCKQYLRQRKSWTERCISWIAVRLRGKPESSDPGRDADAPKPSAAASDGPKKPASAASDASGDPPDATT